MLEALDNIGLAVSDVPRAVRFYTEVLGFTGSGDENEGSVTLGDFSLYIFKTPVEGQRRTSDFFTNPQGIDHLSFRVAKLEDGMAELERRGVVFDGPVVGEPGEFRYRPFRDPDGNMLYVIQLA